MPTIGVAIGVPEPWSTRIQAFRESIDDPMAELIPPHITLLPPIDLASVVAAQVDEHLEAAAASIEAFEVHLRGTATFRPLSPVVFLNLVQGIAGCEMLERAVRTGPLGIDTRFPYHPHVTIAHDVPEDVLDRAFDELADFDARFCVDTFTLFTHGDDGWQVAREFPLRAHACC